MPSLPVALFLVRSIDFQCTNHHLMLQPCFALPRSFRSYYPVMYSTQKSYHTLLFKQNTVLRYLVNMPNREDYNKLKKLTALLQTQTSPSTSNASMRASKALLPLSTTIPAPFQPTHHEFLQPQLRHQPHQVPSKVGRISASVPSRPVDSSHILV